MKKEPESYYEKKSVYGCDPLREVIYEIEDAYEYDSFSEKVYVPKDKLEEILLRHSNTVREFKKRIEQLFQ